jgi:lysophospholipase L1-like esterase
LGASTTFGWGIQQAEAYHEVLEQMLNDSAQATGSHIRFEIVNGGVIGYNLWQVATSMRRIIDRLQPDGFLVAHTFNDAWNRAGSLSGSEQEKILSGVRRKNLLRASALFNWLNDLRARRLARRTNDDRQAGELAIAQTGDSAATAAELKAHGVTLDSMVAMARRASLALAFVVPASRGQRAPTPRQALMARVGTTANLPVIDLAAEFAARDPDAMYLPDDAVHPTPLGHAAMARVMYAELCRFARRARGGDPLGIYRPGCGSESYKPRL